MNQAVEKSIAAGVSYAVAAGNSNADACRTSPAMVPTAMTVGATDPFTDIRASWSNWGDCVDWFAPGVGIKSAGTASTTGWVLMSGTSMAAPHVAGVAAQYLQGAPAAKPAEVTAAVRQMTLKDRVGSANVKRVDNDHLLHTEYTPPTIP